MRSAVLPRAPSSARRARRLLLDVLEHVGQRDPRQRAVAELLVSELATNAIRYGRGADFRVEVELEDAALRVAVHDRSRELPRPRRAGPTEEGGRGVHLVQTLASAWGSTATGAGKVVWFHLDPPSPDGDPLSAPPPPRTGGGAPGRR